MDSTAQRVHPVAQQAHLVARPRADQHLPSGQQAALRDRARAVRRSRVASTGSRSAAAGAWQLRTPLAPPPIVPTLAVGAPTVPVQAVPAAADRGPAVAERAVPTPIVVPAPTAPVVARVPEQATSDRPRSTSHRRPRPASRHRQSVAAIRYWRRHRAPAALTHPPARRADRVGLAPARDLRAMRRGAPGPAAPRLPPAVTYARSVAMLRPHCRRSANPTAVRRPERGCRAQAIRSRVAAAGSRTALPARNVRAARTARRRAAETANAHQAKRRVAEPTVGSQAFRPAADRSARVTAAPAGHRIPMRRRTAAVRHPRRRAASAPGHDAAAPADAPNR